MKLADGHGIKVPRWLANEIVKNSDINFIHESTYKNLIDELALLLAPASASSSDPDVVVGEGLRMVWSAGMTSYLQPGVALSFQGRYFTAGVWAYAAESGAVFGVVAGEAEAVAVDTGDGSDRYDTIEIRPVQTLYDSQSRDFRDPITGIVTTTAVETKIEYGFEVQVLKGTPGAGVAPNHTAGWIKIAEIFVGAGVSVITQDDIVDAEWSMQWTAEAGCTKRAIIQTEPVPRMITTSPVTLVSNTINYVNSSSRVTLPLPSSSKVGDVIEIIAIGRGGYQITQGAGQSIAYMNTSTFIGTLGALRSRMSGSAIKLLCIVADTTWQAVEIRDHYVMKGFLMGGNGVATIQSLNCNTDLISTIDAVLSGNRRRATGVSCALKGYTMGGQSDGITAVDIIENLDFSDETVTTLAATLDTAKAYGAGVSGPLKGYCMGGMPDMLTPTYTDVIEDMNFSTETSAAIVATLDTAKSGGAGVSGPLKGYCMGGVGAGTTYSVEIDDLDFSAETSSLLSAVLGTPRAGGCPVSGFVRGYCAGGHDATPAVYDVIDDMDYTAEASAVLTIVLTAAHTALIGVQGYIG